MKNSTEIFSRLREVLGAKNDNEAAEKLGINPSTYRGRVSRGAVPFEEIVQKLNRDDLLYVLKGEEKREVIRFRRMDPGHHHVKEGHGNYAATAESLYERFSVDLVEKIKDAPFSQLAKLRLIDSVIDIVEKDLREIQIKAGQDPHQDD